MFKIGPPKRANRPKNGHKSAKSANKKFFFASFISNVIKWMDYHQKIEIWDPSPQTGTFSPGTTQQSATLETITAVTAAACNANHLIKDMWRSA